MVCDEERWCVRVCEKVVCERWCVWKLCVKESVWQSCVWKMVCDKVVCDKDGVAKDGVWQSGVWKMVCQRWCVTKLCVKNGVLKDGVWKMVCERWCVTKWCVTKWCVKDGVSKMVCVTKSKLCVKNGVLKDGVWKMVCERWCVTKWCVTKWCVKDGVSKMVCGKAKLCVKNGVLKDGVWKMVCERWCVTRVVCDKVVCEKWCVWQRWCVEDGVWKMVCDKVSEAPATQNDGGCGVVSLCHACHVISMVNVCDQVPRLPRETMVWCVTKCHAGATQRWCGAPGDKSGPSVTHSTSECHACHAKRRWMWVCATPATWYQGECHQVPRLPRETKVDVTKCHACHAKWRGAPGDKSGPSAPHSTMSATPATQNDGGCEFVPRLPRDIKVNVTKCHACHVKRRWMSPSATPATQSGAAPLATNPDQARHTVPWVPRLPRKTTVDVSLCHACHVKRRWMSPSATPATQSGAAPQATNPDQARHTVPWVPRLPRKTTVDVSGCVPRLPRDIKVNVTNCLLSLPRVKFVCVVIVCSVCVC